MVYTIALILQAVLDIDYTWTILIIGVITVIYSFWWNESCSMGRCYSDDFTIWGLLCVVLWMVPGRLLGGLDNGFPTERLQVIDFNLGIGETKNTDSGLC